MTDTGTTRSATNTMLRPVLSDLLAGVPGIVHGLTYRVEGLGAADGNMALGPPRDKADAWRMRELWSEAIGVDPESIVTMGQIHETTILRSEAGDAGRGARPDSKHLGMGDGIITDAPGVTLMTLHADCQPILLVDPERPAVAAVHAGWRGTVSNIAGSAVNAMRDAYGSVPAKLLAYLGPAIGGCCNEVGPEVTAMWRATAAEAGIDPEPALTRPSEREHLNVSAANRLLLGAACLADDHIDVSDECTKCDPERWFSHRAHGPLAGREAALIAIRP
jgi:YfiH family protein